MISETPSPRGELGITTALREYRDGLRAVPFDGLWLDVSYYWDILSVNGRMLERFDTPHAESAGIHDRATVVEGTVLSTDVRASAEIASEYEFTGGRDPWRTLVVVVTQSGETGDTLAALKRAKRAGARTLAVTNTVGSSVTREADYTVFIRAGPEIGVAATKTFCSQVATLALVAVHVGRKRGTISTADSQALLSDLRGLPGAVQQVLDDEEQVRWRQRSTLTATRSSSSEDGWGRRLPWRER